MTRLTLPYLLALLVLSEGYVIFDPQSHRYIFDPATSPNEKEQFPGIGKYFFGASNWNFPIYSWAHLVHACGNRTTDKTVPLVVNGSPTIEGEWPWHVAIYSSQTVDLQYICGGTLINQQRVITAAHCTTVRNTRPFQTVKTSSLTVYLGRFNLVTTRTGYQTRYIKSIIVHPEYNPKIFHNDVSVLWLDEAVQFNDRVYPACLWIDEQKDLNFVIDKEGTVVGYGNDGTGELKRVQMPVVNQETCIRSQPDFYGRVTSTRTFCAGFRDGRSASNGDSGGGMFFKINGFWYIRGIVSLARAKDDENIGDPSHYVVFTDLAQFLPWIRRHIGY